MLLFCLPVDVCARTAEHDPSTSAAKITIQKRHPLHPLHPQPQQLVFIFHSPFCPYNPPKT